MDKEKLLEDAVNKMINENYNCSQTIVYAMLMITNKLIENENLIKQARIFGGGVAGLRQTCGYITGCALVYNMLYDENKAKEKVQALSKVVAQTGGSLQCEKIIEKYDDQSLKGRKENCSKMLAPLLDYLIKDLNIN